MNNFRIYATNRMQVAKQTPKRAIEINPRAWSKASNQKKWYLIYHELGYDVFNFEHGEGGKMMFTFSDREYSWEEFFDDKKDMFDYYIFNH